MPAYSSRESISPAREKSSSARSSPSVGASGTGSRYTMSRTMSFGFVLPCHVSLTGSNTRSTAPSQSTARSMCGVRNMMAATLLTPSVATKRRWLPLPPTFARLRIVTPRVPNSGFLLPWPNGCITSSASMFSTVISSSPTSAVTSPRSSNSSSGSASITSSSDCLNESRLAASHVTPTAPACPPKRTSSSEHCSTAWNRSTEPTERPDPRAMPSEMENRIAGT